MVQYNHRYKYKELCKALGLEVCSGGKQQNQLRKLSKEYDFKKDRSGNYIILKKYDEIQQIENQTYHKYKNYITPMLYTILSNSPNNIVEFDMKDLLESLALINKNWFVAKWNLESSEYIINGENTSTLLYFMKATEPMLRRIVKDVLEEMQDMELIEVQEYPKFAKKYRGDNGKYYTKIFTIDVEEEYPLFINGKRLALKELGVEKYSELNFYQQQDFKHLVEKYLKANLGIDYFFYSYRLILNKKGINELLTERYSDFKESLNQYIQNKISESKRKDYECISVDEKNRYIKALIDIKTDLNLKEKLNK